MDKYLLLDCDETCLDWVQGFKIFADKELGIKLVGQPDQYSMLNWMNMTDKNEVMKLVHDFNDNYEGFGSLKPIANAEIYLPKFFKEGYKIIAITASSSKELSKKRRTDNLHDVFGNIFEEIHCVDTPEEKKKYLQKFPPSIWCEDKIWNAEMGLEFNHKCFLIRSLSSIGHEQKYPKLIWVNDWEEIYNNK